MRIKSIDGEFAAVETDGLIRRVNIQMLPQVKTGDYIIVHAGFAIEKLDPKKAGETLRLVDEIR